MMGISSCCGIGLVAEKLLNREQVDAILGEPCCEAVSKVMKSEVADVGFVQGGLEGPAELVDIHCMGSSLSSPPKWGGS